MGNLISKKYQNYYLESMFTNVKNDYDNLIGNFKIIHFAKENIPFMVTTLNPSLYHHYTDVELFKKKFSKTSPFLTTFLFVEMNKEKSDEFDFIFEFGNFFTKRINEENQIVATLHNFLDSLIDLESKTLHYPKLDTKYIIQNNLGEIKLLNPLCFSQFLEDLTNIYINPKISESQKDLFSQKKLENNRSDFLEFVLSLFSNINYKLFKCSDIYRHNFFLDLQKKFTPNFFNFLKYITENQTSSFREIKNFLNNFYQQTNNNSNNKRFTNSNREPFQSEVYERFSVQRDNNHANFLQRTNELNKNLNLKLDNINNTLYSNNINKMTPKQNFVPSFENQNQKSNKENLTKSEKKFVFDTTPKKNENIFKKELNTPTPNIYEKKNTFNDKNVKSFSSYTNKDYNLINKINLDPPESLRNLDSYQNEQKHDSFVETEKKKNFQNMEKSNSKDQRLSSCEKTLKKNKSKIFFNSSQQINSKNHIQTNKNHFTLYLNEKIKLFEYVLKNDFNYFNSINGIVDRNNPLKPSIYHNVENFPDMKKKPESTNINKYYYKKSLQNLDVKENINTFDIDREKIRRLSEKREAPRNVYEAEQKRTSVSRILFKNQTNNLGISLNSNIRRF